MRRELTFWLFCLLTLSACKTGPSLFDQTASGVSAGIGGDSLTDGQSGIDPAMPIDITFSQSVIPLSINDESAFIAKVTSVNSPCSGNKLTSTKTLSSSDKVLTFTADFACGSTYAVCLTENVIFVTGGRLLADPIQFSTRACSKATITSIAPSSPSQQVHPIVQGQAPANYLVSIYDNDSCSGNVLGTATANSDGTYAAVLSLLTDQTYTMTAKAQLRTSSTYCSDATSYTLDRVAPSVVIGTASASLVNSTTSVDYAVTYAGASQVTLANSDITLNKTGTANCNVNVTGSGTATRTVTLSTCTGNGTVGFVIEAGTARDAAGNISIASSASAVFTVDNQAPASAIFSPSTGTLTILPPSPILTFTENIAASSVSPSDFVIGGSCAGVTVDSVAVLGGAITINLGGTGGCTLGKTISLSLDFSNITDSAGNIGSGTAFVLYTRDNVGPTSATFNPPSSTRNPLPASITVTYDEQVISSSVSASDFVIGGTCPGVTIASVVAIGDTNTATVNLSGTNGCANGQTVALTANYGAVLDTLLNAGSGSNTVTYTRDSNGPAVVSVNPVTGKVKPMPQVAIFTLSPDVNPTTVSQADFSLAASTCVGVSMSAFSVDQNSVTIVFDNTAGCMNGQTIAITADLTGIRDQTLPAGNPGAGTFTVTYTLDTQGVAVTSFTPAASTIWAIPATVQVALSPDVSPASVAAGDFSVSGTCAGVTVSSLTMVGNTAQVHLNGTAGCLNNQTVTLNVNLTTIQDMLGNPGVGSMSATYTLDTIIPTITGWSPGGGVVAVLPTTVDVAFSADIDPLSIGPSDFPISGCPGVSVNSITQLANVARLNLIGMAGCVHGQFITIEVDMSEISDLAGNSGFGTSSVTFTLDTIGPDVLSFSPTTSRVNPVPNDVAVTFSPDVDNNTVTMGDFIISNASTCLGVTITGITKVANVTTVHLAGTVGCQNGETVILQVQTDGVADVVGNYGTQVPNVTYTFDNVGPVVTGINPPTSRRNPLPTSITFTWNGDINGSTVDLTDFTTGGTCVGPTILDVQQSGSVSTVTIAGLGVCASGQSFSVTADHTGVIDTAGNVGAGSTIVTYTLDSLPPTVLSFNPVSGAPPAPSVEITFSVDVDLATLTVDKFTIDSSTCPGIAISGVTNVANVVTVTFTGAETCTSGQSYVMAVNLGAIRDTTLPGGNYGAGAATCTYTAP